MITCVVFSGQLAIPVVTQQGGGNGLNVEPMGMEQVDPAPIAKDDECILPVGMYGSIHPLPVEALQYFVFSSLVIGTSSTSNDLGTT